MANQTYDDKFSSLTENEIIVLNAKCRGVPFDEIARRMGFRVAWAYPQQGNDIPIEERRPEEITFWYA